MKKRTIKNLLGACAPAPPSGAEGRGEGVSPRVKASRFAWRRVLTHPLEFTLALVLALTPLGGAYANPQGGQVVGGQATIQGQGTKTVTVNQQSQNAIINWNTFNIAAGELTQFNQPNANAIVLNRVTGNLGPSQIYGTITANGRVFLVNPDGILFGLGSRVDAAGFLASTNDIHNRAFMHGHYNFNIPGRLDASIVNLGDIRITPASGGFAALVAPGVRNDGVISARLGNIALASGNGFTLDFYGDKLITLQVDHGVANQVIDVATGQPLTSLVENNGKLRANGGTVALTAAAARTVVDSVINNTGVIEANTVGTRNGMIVLGAATAGTKPRGAPTQNVVVSGTLSARGTHANQTGGTVVITGESIALQGAKVDASGTAGGGTVLIGGDTGGGHLNAAVANIPQAQLQHWPVALASMVSIDKGSVIDASATQNGNGGKVVVWSNELTTFAGLIRATGGVFGGNGGFVEVSSHGTLSYTGLADLRAPKGTPGTLLLDPQDVMICSDCDGQTIDPKDLETQLGQGSVIITTALNQNGSGNITVGDGISWSTNSSLTLSAYNSIFVNAPISSTGGGGVTLHADNTGTGVGTVRFGDGGSVATTGAVSIFYNQVGNDNTSVNESSYTTPTDFSGVVSAGTLNAYMLVNTVYDLQNVRNNFGGTYALGRNIDASPTATWNDGQGFVPIGPRGNGFTGIFDGQNHIISGLAIAPTYASGFAAIGLFGINSGTIQNVSLTNVSITADPNIASRSDFGTLPGSQYVGAIAGVNKGLIDTVSASGHINGVSVGGASLGGLVGYNNSLFSYGHDDALLMIGTIQNSSSSVTVTAGDRQFCAFESCINVTNFAGGLVGFNGGNITGSFATGNVASISSSGGAEVGGLVGANSGTITGAYAMGSVSSSGSSSYAGGLVGLNGQVAGDGFYIILTGASITQSWSGGAVTATGQGSNAGGLVGGNGVLATIDHSYAVGPVTVGATSLAGGLVGVNGGSITQTYATGPVTGGTASILGGLVAVNSATSQNSDSSTMISGTVASSYWDVATTGQLHSAGSADTFGLTTAQFGNSGNFADWKFGTTPGGSGWVVIDANGSLNNANGEAGATRPMLLSEWSTTISNPHQLELINLDLSANYQLANNIGLDAPLTNPSRVFAPNGAAGFVPIGSIGDPFNGTFDGQGHTIAGLVIAPVDKQVNSVGLFGANTGTIQDLNLANVSITANSNVGLPGQFVGTLTGQNFGFIGNVTASGTINGLNLAGVTAGGLVGQNGTLGSSFTGGVGGSGTINADVARATRAADDAQSALIVGSHADVSVTLGDGILCTGGGCNGGFNNAGGLVGFNVATISYSSASGAITVGANTFAGGLVGTNQNATFPNEGPPVALTGPQIIGSWASGAVSSTQGAVALGGLVGYNAPLAVIWSSSATGNVTSRASATGDCSPNCVFANAGGLVGQNQGEILGRTLPAADSNCTVGFACAGGIVSVGIGSTGGGLVGQNQGIIRYAFATGDVRVFVPGDAAPGGDFSHMTTLGGLVGGNQGIIAHTFAGGAVGNANVVNLDVGGLVGDNGGVIWRSAAFGPVVAGAHSLAGGVAGNNNPSNPNCDSCSLGDGFNQKAVIAHSGSRGSVTVGADSVGGGITAINSGTLRGDHSGSAVTGDHDSVVAGLVGINDLTGLIKYSRAWGSATDMGQNSIVAGLVGVNGGNIVDSRSRAEVNGGSDSYVGGLVGINVGAVQDSNNSGSVAVAGGGNVVGGFVAFNVGTIDPSFASGSITGGSGSIVGGFAGGNFNIPNAPAGFTLPGTISNDSNYTGPSTSYQQVASTSMTPAYPTPPAFFLGCGAPLCGPFQPGGIFDPSPTTPQPTPSTPPVTDQPPPTQQVILPPNNDNTTQPTLVNLTTTPGNGNGTGTSNNNGNHTNNAGPPQSPGPPPGPGLGRTYDEQHFSGVPPIGETRFLKGEIVVQISNTVPLSTVMKIAQQLGITLISSQSYDVNGRIIYRFSVTNGKDIRVLIAALEKNQIIASAQPNYVYILGQSAAAPAPAAAPPPEQTDSIPPKAPAEPGLANADTASLETLPAGDAAQYVIDKMHLVQIHNLARGRNVVVAVIDSEIDANHPDLKGDIIERFDATQTPSHPHVHGTGMAGAIAAHQRLLGVAPGVKLLAIKAFDEQAASAEATSVQILKGLEFAMAHKARVINMSFAGPRDPMLERTLKLAHDKGIILVAAAGNAGPKSPPLYPGADPNVIAVTASDYNDKPFTMANRGKYIAVGAPGVDVMVPAPGNTYQLTTGTSVATAHVSGVAALLVERKPSITPDEVRTILMRTAIPYAARPKGEEDGAGLVDPVAALKALGPGQSVQVVPHTNGSTTH